MGARHDAPLAIAQVIGGVEKQFMSARLRLFGQAKTAIGIDIDRPDRVHLKGDFHALAPGLCAMALFGPSRAKAQDRVAQPIPQLA